MWKNPLYIKAWIYCLYRANYKETKVLIGSKLNVAEVGTFFTSIHNFSEATGLSPKQTRTLWGLLENDKMLVRKATNNATKLTVCNYAQYQVTGQTEDKQKTNEGQTKGNGERSKEVKTKKLNTLSELPASDRLKEDQLKKLAPKTEKKIDQCIPFARTLTRIVQSQINIDINTHKRRAWANEFRKLVYDTEKVGKDRVVVVLEWYRKNVGGEFVPVVQSGKSFREKFVKLEAAMERGKANGQKGYTPRHGVRDVVSFEEKSDMEIQIKS